MNSNPRAHPRFLVPTPALSITAVIVVFVLSAGVAPATPGPGGDSAAPGPTLGLADPSATTTTTTIASDLVTRTTTRSPTSPTSTTAVTSTAPPTTPASSSALPVVTPTSPATTAPPSEIAASVPIGEAGQLVSSATAPRQPETPAAIGQWSVDPTDWSPDVRDYLVAQGLDLDNLAAQSAAAAGAPGQLLSNEGCAVNCITSGLAHAVGVGVYLEVTTSVPAFIQIEILDVGLKFGPPSAHVWGATWAHLEPGTIYQAIARAHDGQGNMAVAAGEFTTMTRSAQITFTPTVFWFGNLPDFDPFGDHLWQLSGTAYLNGDAQASATGEPALNADIMPTAAALALTVDTGTIDDSVIEVAYVGTYDCVVGCEEISLWDLFVEAIFGSTPPQAVPPKVQHANGVTPTSFWGTVANGIQLDGYPDDVTSWTGHEFTFPLSTFDGDPVGPPVYLTFDVTVTVSYDPPS